MEYELRCPGPVRSMMRLAKTNRKVISLTNHYKHRKLLEKFEYFYKDAFYKEA